LPAPIFHPTEDPGLQKTEWWGAGMVISLERCADLHIIIIIVGAKLQATNRVPRPVDRGTATRYGG